MRCSLRCQPGFEYFNLQQQQNDTIRHLLLIQWQKHTWIGLLYFPGWHTTARAVFSAALHKSSYTCLQLKRLRAICAFSSRNLWIDLREAGSDNKSEQREGHRGFRCVRLWFSVESARGGWRVLACHSWCRRLPPAGTPAVLCLDPVNVFLRAPG